MEWDWNFVWQIMPTLLEGLKITLLATVLGAAVAAVIGLVFAILRMTAPKPIAKVTGFVVEFIRGTPLLVQLYFIFYVLPDIGLRLPALLAGVIGLGLHYGTYAAEVYRAGIENVPRGQWEAAKATNLTGRQTWIHVILPQALPLMLPTFGNNAIELLKGTAVVSLISLTDMTFQAQVVRAQTGSTLIPFATILVLYFLMALAISTGMRWLERRVTRGLDGVRT